MPEKFPPAEYDRDPMTDTKQPPAPPPPTLRWYQYRLRSLLILTTLTAVFFSVGRTLGYVDAVICLAAFLVLVAFLRYPRPVDPVTGVVLALVAATLLWANLRPTEWARWCCAGMPAPGKLDPVTEAMFYRGFPLTPCLFCVIYFMRSQPSGTEWWVLVVDGVVFAAALLAVRITCRWRCDRPTPSRILLVPLVVEGLAWHCDRFHWPYFPCFKGYAVLVAAAAAGLFLFVISGWFVFALLFHQRFQVTVRFWLALVLVVGIPCSWLAVEIERAEQQKVAVTWIRKVGGEAYYCGPEATPWPRRLLGTDFFNDVGAVRVGGSEVDDASLEHLTALTQLEKLDLGCTKITDAGLKHLEGLTRLRWLDLYGADISDAGLKHLEGLANLEELGVGETNVTFVGVQKLRQSLPKCAVSRGGRPARRW
ncbi:MAG: hypothetical protein ACLQLG_01820 [Thermoguttaceae bacterium]